MSYRDELSAELGAVGIRGRLARRILAEVDDHLLSDPASEERFGRPPEIAEAFAAELGTQASRRAARLAFAALAFAGAVYAAVFVAVGAAGQPSADFAAASLALAVVVLAPQVAFVSGSLALVRALRQRATTVPAAELEAINRRTLVGLAAGAAAMGGLALYVVVLREQLPAWIVELALVATPAAALLLGAAAVPAAAAARLHPRTAGGAGDVFDDLPIRRTEPWRFARRVAVAVGLAVWLQAALQGDPLDGIALGAVEAAACLGGFALLGRYLHLRR